MYNGFFRHNTIAHNSLQYSVKVTFICIGKPKTSCDSLYGDIRNICAALELNLRISEVCLYSETEEVNDSTWTTQWSAAKPGKKKE